MHFGRTGPRTSGHLVAGSRTPPAQPRDDLPTVLHTPRVHLTGRGAVPWADGTGASWSPAPLPQTLNGPADRIARRHDALSVVDHGDSAELHAGVSGAVPVYVRTGDDGVRFSSAIQQLVAADRAIRPDWDGWAQMLATGAPLDGRTTVAGVRRLRPWERVRVDDRGQVSATHANWPWLDVTPSGRATAEQVGAALSAAVQEIGDRTPLAPMLSGGWDSRILTVLAGLHSSEQVVARTTSSDTGTVMEELIAAKVAEHIGVDHRILMPRRDQFGDDLHRFAEAVDHQTAFHIWFVPVQRDLHPASGTALDGLGGGLFLGGTFADLSSSDQSALDQRFGRLTRYLQAAPAVLSPQAISTIRDRTRAGFETVAAPLADHPFADTFTAYLNRTVPGISHAPYGLLAASTTVATPFLDHRVVTAALQIPADHHRGGRLYPKVLTRFHPQAASIPTAQELVPWPRPHPRRTSAPESARTVRDLVLTEPIRPLVADHLATADLAHWSRLLSTTGGQHLLRSLAVMALWFDHHRTRLGGVDAGELAA